MTTSPAPSWSDHRTVTDRVADLEGLTPIGLAEVQSMADLQRRFDDKHVVPMTALPELLQILAPRMRVLEISGRRVVPYTTTYFDTPDLRTLRDHRQGRRRRYKVRTRQYGDPGGTMLELKRKGRRGETIKHRWPHPCGDPAHLNEEARALLAAALASTYGLTLPSQLRPAAVTRFERTTLADPIRGERVTIDRGLTVTTGGHTRQLGHTMLVVETKSPVRGGGAAGLLRELGLRPVSVSKYGVCLAALRPDLGPGPWGPALRRLDGATTPATTG